MTEIKVPKFNKNAVYVITDGTYVAILKRAYADYDGFFWCPTVADFSADPDDYATYDDFESAIVDALEAHRVYEFDDQKDFILNLHKIWEEVKPATRKKKR